MIVRTLAAAAALAFAGAAVAQEPAADYSEAKLDAFAEAAVDVNLLMRNWQGKLQMAESQEVAEAMMAEANEEITEAIRAADGITLEEYEAIAAAAQADPEFAERVREEVRQELAERQAAKPQPE